jgi:DNA-binding NarL/FixJ family response regulator
VKKIVNIVIVEVSSIVSEGLSAIFNKSGLKCTLSFSSSLNEAELQITKNKSELVIINPSFIQNSPKPFNTLKCQFRNVKWVGLQYNFYDQKTLSLFDAIITISDSPESIGSIIKKLLAGENQHMSGSSQDVLSEREIDVLKLLATGMANKEIADKLNISTNTVITHRKNISQKTGIKSVSGLTIYAVVQKLVSIESFLE